MFINVTTAVSVSENRPNIRRYIFGIATDTHSGINSK